MKKEVLETHKVEKRGLNLSIFTPGHPHEKVTHFIIKNIQFYTITGCSYVSFQIFDYNFWGETSCMSF